jgi:hypothetical protein
MKIESLKSNPKPIEELSMKLNVGGIDRILRIVVGAALLVWGFVLSPAPVYWAAIGAVPLLTGLIGWCPAYLLIGFSSKK